MPLPQTTAVLMEHQHLSLFDIIKDIDETGLKQHMIEGKWSAFENIVHLVAYQPTFMYRLQRILHEDQPVFERYTADNDPHFHACLQQSLPDLMEDFQTDRLMIMNNLRALSAVQLERKANHPKFGLLDIAGWAQFFLLHEAHHLFTIFGLVTEYKKQQNQ